jgi:hypothetical protein
MGLAAAQSSLPVLKSLTGKIAWADTGSSLYTYDLTYTMRMNREDVRERRRIWDHAHFVSSVQGIVNRYSPRLYVFLVGRDSAESDKFWLGELRKDGEWLADTRLEVLPNLDALVRAFSRDLNGLVVYDENVPATSNVASTVAGAENLACVRYEHDPDALYYWLAVDTQGPRLPVKVWLVNRDGSSLFTGQGTIPGTKTPSTGSAKCDAYIWAIEKYLKTGRCNPSKMGYYLDAYWLKIPDDYIPNHTLTNHDYFISNKGFVFDLYPWDDEAPVDDPHQSVGTDFKTLVAILRSAWRRLRGQAMVHIGGFPRFEKKYSTDAGGKHEPVPTECRFSEIISCFNAYMDADAPGFEAMANASVFQHYPLEQRYTQSVPTTEDLRTRGFITPEGKLMPKSYISFFVGDYDSAAWFYQKVPEMWNDPARGTIPLGWPFNPNLADRFAPGMVYTRRLKSRNDFFIAGDSGAGYLNPGCLEEPRKFSGLPSGLKVWSEHCQKYYRRWDLSLTGFIIDGYAPHTSGKVLDAYAAFSPDGVVLQIGDGWGVHSGMPFITMDQDIQYHPPEESARRILAKISTKKPEFFIFRTILMTPSDHKKMVDAVKATVRSGDVEIVDPYTLLLLVKHHATKA